MLAGCQAVPHAPVIYASNWSVGLVVEQAASDPAPTINLGVQIDDAAWVPAITCATLTRDGKAPADPAPCISRLVYADDKGDGSRDAFSVFGTFNSRPTATGGTPASGTTPAAPLGASLSAGKVFSMGVAADNIASGSGPTHHKACIESISKEIDATSTKLDELKVALAICGVRMDEKPKS
jgi:hypothetical protein